MAERHPLRDLPFSAIAKCDDSDDAASLWADWGAGEVGPECECCGGFALERPCPICAGQCGAVWQWAVQDSWDQGQAIWVGACKSPK